MIGVPLNTFNLVQKLSVDTGYNFYPDEDLPPSFVCIPQLQLRNELKFHNNLRLLDFFCDSHREQSPVTNEPQPLKGFILLDNFTQLSICIPQLQLRNDLQFRNNLQLFDFFCD